MFGDALETAVNTAATGMKTDMTLVATVMFGVIMLLVAWRYIKRTN